MEADNWRNHIDLGERPSVKRSGVSVELVLTTLGQADSIESVLAAIPGLTREEIAACLAYAADAISRAAFVDSIRRGLDDTSAGRLTDDQDVWDGLDRDSEK